MNSPVLLNNSKSPLRFIGQYAYTAAVAIILVASQLMDEYIILSMLFFSITVLMVLDRLGKGIILRELIAMHSLFVCIFVPVLGYLFYTKGNALARMWVRFMPIPEKEYFGYALPAMCLFVLVLCLPMTGKVSDQGEIAQGLLNKARKPLNERPRTGLILMVLGLVAFFISPLLPDFLQFVATLVFWGSFAGALYLFFSKTAKNKRPIFILFTLIILANALNSGMFTIVVYMGITLFSFFFLGKRFAFWKKIIAFVFCVFALILIQSVKQNYRTLIWRQGYSGDKFVLFGSLLVDKWNSTSSFFTEDEFFPIYYRTNQGFNISLVMRRFPRIKSFDDGENLWQSFAAALVPRLFWPDKPEAGGKANMKYYTGIELKGWSTNVGPLGEAYGSFGKTGGMFYMFFLGWLIRWSYRRVFVIATRIPLLIFWIPVLFYQVTYSAESDTLQIVNSLVKSAFFLWVLYKLVPGWFGMAKEKFPLKFTRRTVNQIQPVAEN